MSLAVHAKVGHNQHEGAEEEAATPAGPLLQNNTECSKDPGLIKTLKGGPHEQIDGASNSATSRRGLGPSVVNAQFCCTEALQGPDPVSTSNEGAA